MELIRRWETGLVQIGSETRVGDPLTSVVDIGAALRSSNPLRHDDVRYALALAEAGDMSPLVVECEREIPAWPVLPLEARVSFLEAERRYRDLAVDYSPTVAGFAKAVEVSLRRGIFEEFRQAARSEPAVIRQAQDVLSGAASVSTRDQDKARNLALFVEGRQSLELGGMRFALSLTTGETARRVGLLGSLRAFLSVDPRLARWMEAGRLSDLDRLTRDYRNPAVHQQIFKKADATAARQIAVELLTAFGREPAKPRST